MSDQTVVEEKTAQQIYDNMNGNFQEFASTIDEVGVINKELANCWQGPKAKNYIEQLDAFLPNLIIGYNILEKSQSDLATCVKNIVTTDNTTS